MSTGITLHLVFRSATGHVRGRAIARGVRITPTLYVVERQMVEVLEGAARFGAEHRFRRDTLQRHPKPNPLSGNGRWGIERVEGGAQ